MNDHAGAIDDFTRAIAEDPNNADFYHNRGFAKRKLGDFPGAVLDYTAAIRLNANPPSRVLQSSIRIRYEWTS